MTDLLTSTPPPPPPSVPPPPGPVDAPPTAPEHRRGGWRFGGGLVAGVVLGLLAVGAIALVRRDGPDAAPPSTTTPATAPVVQADSPTGVPGSVHDIVVAVRPSIAAIHTTVQQTDVFGRVVDGQAAGSGFVLSADGYVVTNNHVVEGATDITVTLDDGATEPAELVAADPRSDLAVLHVDRTDLQPLALGDSDAIQTGDPVIAVGNALDLGAEPTVTAGLISAKDRTITEPNGQVLVNLMQTDAAISPGNSGGPLLDHQGRVVGINTAIAGQGQNIGFAIAINPARTLIDELRDGQVPRHALLGVTTAVPDNGDGAAVMSVEAGSAAAAAGIQVGDVIVRLDADTITSPEDLVASIARHAPGDEVDVDVLRGQHTVTVTVTLGAHDETNS